MGKNHIRVYHELPEAELGAVVDQDAASAERLAGLYGARAYTDWREMVERERPAAVTVAVPTQAHFPIAGALLDAGCHVLIEKPIAATIAEGRELVRRAE